MPNNGHGQFYLVDGDALPEVFIRVTQARELLDTGRAQTVAEAAEQVGISRSAYYKYKNAVMPFQNVAGGRIVTFQIMLRHKMGLLSAVLGVFADTGANILTINQGIPVNGCAVVTVNAETSGMREGLQDLLERIDRVQGVLRGEVLAG